MNNVMFNPNALLALGGAMLAFILVIGIGLYVYMALALMTIGKKLNYEYP
jgi:hypothetical protein